MAPIKFEEHIKEQLEERTLKPSNEAWQKLTNRLDTEEKSQNRGPIWWIGIAASIAILIAITLPFFNNDTDKTQPTLVNTKDEIIEKETIKTNGPIEVLEIQQDNNIVLEETEVKEPIDKTVLKKLQKNSANTSEINKRIADVKISETSIQQDLTKETITQQAIQTFEEVKILDVVAEIKKMKNTPSGISDREIDSLLNEAHKEILNRQLYNETTKTVDADALLQDVEADLEQSFRTKVFEALKTNYNKVKTAVAERNN